VAAVVGLDDNDDDDDDDNDDSSALLTGDDERIWFSIRGCVHTHSILIAAAASTAAF
jgi:hypothetical protein